MKRTRDVNLLIALFKTRPWPFLRGFSPFCGVHKNVKTAKTSDTARPLTLAYEAVARWSQPPSDAGSRDRSRRDALLPPTFNRP